MIYCAFHMSKLQTDLAVPYLAVRGKRMAQYTYDQDVERQTHTNSATRQSLVSVCSGIVRCNELIAQGVTST